MEILPQIVLIVVLTFVNAYFSLSEMAVVSINKRKIEELAAEGNKKANKLLKLTDDQTKFLSTIQVGITFAGFYSSASAATGLAGYVGKFFESLGVSTSYSSTVAIVVVTLILIFISLVFGELLPKRIALQAPEKTAMNVAGKILVVKNILGPFVRLLSFSTNLILKILGVNTEKLDDHVTEEEIKKIIAEGKNNGIINQMEEKMIHGVFQFEDYVASDVMTPRKFVYSIDASDPVSEYIDEMLATNYSRIPVYENDIDNVIGVLYIKDFLREAKKVGFENINIKKIMKPPFYVSLVKKVDALFHEMQTSKKHMAILIDEFGGFAGIITLEDLIEEIVGNIYDEFDESDIKTIDKDNYLVRGMVPIQDLNRILDLDIEKDEDESYDTIAGLIIYLLGRIPEENEKVTVEYKNLILKIEKIDNSFIELVKLTKKENINENEKINDDNKQ